MTTTRRDFLKIGAAASVSALCMPRAAYSVYGAEQEAAGNDVVLRCCIMSDVHFTGEVTAKEVPRFRRAIEFTYDYSSKQEYKNFDALLVVGDMSNHGIEKELNLFKKEMDAAVKPGTDTFLCMGNHEFYGGNQGLWKSIFGVEPNRRYERNGFSFIAISPERGTMKDGDYLYAVDFLEKELAAAYKADPEKPIFVFQHYPVSPTVYGGRGFDDWGAEDFFDILQGYPTVVHFSGHTHYPINDPRCAWQGCFSAFGTGTLSYICHGGEGPDKFQKYLPDDGKSAQFYIMEVRRDNSVTLQPYDLRTDSFFDVVYRVPKPGAIDSYSYTDARYSQSEKPTWREGTTVKTTVLESYGATVEFKQAYCKDVVLGYCAELERFDDKSGEWLPAGARFFWSEYYLNDMPEIAKGELDDLDGKTKYRATIKALNPFMRASDDALTCEFVTKENPGEPEDKDVPAPEANFYDIKVVDGAVVNCAQTNGLDAKKIAKHGESKIVKEPLLGDLDVVEFSGKGEYYKSECTDDDFRRLRRATIAATFKPDEDAVGANAIFGDTQIGGLELSYDADAKELTFWLMAGGSYRTLRAPLAPGKYATAFGTYDGKEAILYIDGKAVAREAIKGSIKHTSVAKAKAFCFGSDIAENGGGEAFFKGRIARARLYTWALTEEQVANLSK